MGVVGAGVCRFQIPPNVVVHTSRAGSRVVVPPPPVSLVSHILGLACSQRLLFNVHTFSAAGK